MKKLINMTFFFAVVCLLTACNSDDIIDMSEEINDRQVRFSTGIEASSNTLRVTGEDGTLWQPGDTIGVYMLDNVTGAIAENAENIRYITWNSTTSASFINNNNTPIYYPVDATQKVKFIAYHPYRNYEGNDRPGKPTLIKDYIFMVDTKTQNLQSMLLLMRATADNNGNGYDKNHNASVNLVFNHRMTKLEFNVKNGDGINETDLTRDLTVTVKGLKTKTVYYIDTDVMEDPTDVADMPTRMTRVGTRYEAVVIPQSFNDGDVTVEFALNNAKNEVFKYKMPAKVFAAAQKHVFDVAIQRTSVEVSGEIIPWETQPTETGVAK